MRARRPRPNEARQRPRGCPLGTPPCSLRHGRGDWRITLQRVILLAGERTVDYYEVRQSTRVLTGDIERGHRCWRSGHPENQQKRSESVTDTIEAYTFEGPEKRARYDVMHHQRRRPWRLVSSARSPRLTRRRQVFRRTVLEVLYTQRRLIRRTWVLWVNLKN